MKQGTKIAIMGGSPSSRELEPPGDFEVWAHGNQLEWREGKRVDRIFEIHDDLSEHDPGYAQRLIDREIPLVVGRNFPATIGGLAEIFPFEAAEAMLEGKLTSTPAYMMAYALIHGAQEIAIHGVDMSVDDLEYFHQRPAMYAWIAFAKARGVTVHIPENSSLFADSYIEGQTSITTKPGLYAGVPELANEPFTQEQFTQMAAMHQERRQASADRQTQIVHEAISAAYLHMARMARAVESGQVIHDLRDHSPVVI